MRVCCSPCLLLLLLQMYRCCQLLLQLLTPHPC
jgi:hypothetical protein